MTEVIRTKNHNSKLTSKKQWVCVMNRNPIVDDEFGIEIAYCVDVIGIRAALDKANFYLHQAEKTFANLDYKLEGREW